MWRPNALSAKKKTPYRHNEDIFVSYYLNQASGRLKGFIWMEKPYSSRLGSIFYSLLRMTEPMLESGFSIARPRLKSAETNIVWNVISSVLRNILMGKHKGNGLMMHTHRPGKNTFRFTFKTDMKMNWVARKKLTDKVGRVCSRSARG